MTTTKDDTLERLRAQAAELRARVARLQEERRDEQRASRRPGPPRVRREDDRRAKT